MKKNILSLLLLAGLFSTMTAQASPALDRYSQRAAEIFGEIHTIRLLVNDFGDLTAAAEKMKALDAKLYGLGEDTDPMAAEAIVGGKSDWAKYMRVQKILEDSQKIRTEVEANMQAKAKKQPAGNSRSPR